MSPRRVVHVDQVTGDAVFVVGVTVPPTIPAGKGRVCPQCGETAWLRSRWCWHCEFDFDRAALPWVHPAKVRLVSMLLLSVIAISTGYNAVTSFLSE